MIPTKPDCITIKARKVDFGFSTELPYRWYSGNPAIFNFCNAISIMFPIGEQFFIDSVRHYKDKITDPVLREEVAGFIAQEAMHSKQHDLCNQVLKVQNKQMFVIEKVAKLFLDTSRHIYPARTLLAISCALEHFTALFADQLLNSTAFRRLAHPVYAELWLWHAVEETEHKAVCFDVYQQVAGGVLGYIERCLVMLLVSVCMLTAILLSAILMIIANPKKSAPKQDKPKPVAKKPFATGWIRYLFIKPGIVPYIMVPYFRYYSPFFHPWKHDNSELVERWKAHYANLRAAGVSAQP